MEWRQLVMHLGSLDPDRLEALLLDGGALSITLTDGGDAPILEPAPGETPLWPATTLTALFAADTDLEDVTDRIRRGLDIDELPPWRIETLADRAWEREWLERFGPMRFGRRLWVMPGLHDAPDADAVVVRLDPGLAFGTGSHETTALCLEWLDAADVANKTVFDFGCGSGILGIAALKLGARAVDAMDIDLQAVTATRQNAARNAVQDKLSAGTELPPPGAQYDIVVANILAGTLVDHAAAIVGWTRPGGRIVLSGILAGQCDELSSAFTDRVSFDPPAARQNWVRLSGVRNRQ